MNMEDTDQRGITIHKDGGTSLARLDFCHMSAHRNGVGYLILVWDQFPLHTNRYSPTAVHLSASYILDISIVWVEEVVHPRSVAEFA